jgi:hypothetical protein
VAYVILLPGFEAKLRNDPQNRFHMNQNIEPELRTT